MKKTTLKNRIEEMHKKTKQTDAVRYVLRILESKHRDALDMVQNVPNNVYINEWKQEEKMLAEKVQTITELLDEMSIALYHLCDLISEERNTQNETIEKVLADLSSAYQENAILSAVDTYNDGEEMTAQEFADLACENYREQLKFAGFFGDLGAHSVYKGFAHYGDETEVQSFAFTIYDIITR